MIRSFNKPYFLTTNTITFSSTISRRWPEAIFNRNGSGEFIDPICFVFMYKYNEMFYVLFPAESHTNWHILFGWLAKARTSLAVCPCLYQLKCETMMLSFLSSGLCHYTDLKKTLIILVCLWEVVSVSQKRNV